MQIRIKRIHKDLPLPKRHSERAAAFDLYASASVQILPGEIGYVPLNEIIETPDGHVLIIALRSSAHKRGISMANGIAIGDPDFSGDGDQWKLPCLNFTKQPVTIDKGDRIAEGIFVKLAEWKWDEVTHMGNKDRGGIGSTGNR